MFTTVLQCFTTNHDLNLHVSDFQNGIIDM